MSFRTTVTLSPLLVAALAGSSVAQDLEALASTPECDAQLSNAQK